MTDRDLTQLQASQFALMLLAGVPPGEAATYFLPEGTAPEQLQKCAQTWPKKPIVAAELKRLQGGKDWLQMSKEERMQLALDKHYSEMAFYLYHNNYNDLEGSRKSKADICREALEKKVAGKAGDDDPIAKLFKDILQGKKAIPGVKQEAVTH